MDLSPSAKAHFAQKHMDDAAKNVAAVEEARRIDSEENARTYERFYNNLALFSGSTVALSVTYLGYLKTLTVPVVHKGWLVGSWIAFFICLSSALFWSFFRTHYGHFFRNREYAEKVQKRYETEIEEIRHLRIENLQTNEEIAAFIGPRREAAATSKKNAGWNERREKVYSFVWIWFGRIARIAFVVGLGLLLAFAVKNI
jgi:hypothetical protein